MIRFQAITLGSEAAAIRFAADRLARRDPWSGGEGVGPRRRRGWSIDRSGASENFG